MGQDVRRSASQDTTALGTRALQAAWRGRLRGGPAGRASRAALSRADSARVSGPLALAQSELLDLAGRRLRQRTELDRVRTLVVSQPLTAEPDDLVARCACVDVERDERFRALSPTVVGNPDHGALKDGGV